MSADPAAPPTHRAGGFEGADPADRPGGVGAGRDDGIAGDIDGAAAADGRGRNGGAVDGHENGGADGDGGADGGHGHGSAGQVSAADRAVVAAQLGRAPRAVRAVAHRCPCGLPDVVETSPRLPDGTPFPTLDYLTCPKASAAVGRLEAAGVMREMADRLRTDPALAAGYRAAHEAYLARRGQLGVVDEIAGVSAGGMPTRVKCLHALLAHALAAGPGVNPLGDEVREAVGPWWAAGPCVAADPA